MTLVIHCSLAIRCIEPGRSHPNIGYRVENELANLLVLGRLWLHVLGTLRTKYPFVPSQIRQDPPLLALCVADTVGV